MQTPHAIPRMTRWAALLPLGALLFAAPAPLTAQKPTGPLVQVATKGSVPEVIDRLRKMVAQNGMMVMGELHQGKVLEMTGLHTESETLFVGNPQVGKQLFTADPGAGVAVPVRINVFKNAQGTTVVSYLPPSEILKDLHNDKLDQMTKMLDGKLQTMVGMLARK